jgi:nicotinamidase-related amidase
MRKILIIIDPQNDFIQGSLRNEAAIARIPNIINFINNFDGEEIFVTQDTHFTEDDTPFAPKAYKNTLEGKKLPIEHCLIDTTGWKIDTKLKTVLDNCGKDVTYLQKITFGEYDLPEFIDRGDDEDMLIQIMGFCTDICVISNALILRAYYPNTHIEVYEDCCAGSTLELHKAALMTMESCQIDICTSQSKSKIE